MAKKINERILFKEYGGISESEYIKHINNHHNIENINIDRVISKSEKGRLFIDYNLKLMDNANTDNMDRVYLAIIPTGYNCTETGHPLCTAFIRYGSSFKYYVTKTVVGILETVETKKSAKKSLESIGVIKDIFRDYIELVGIGWKEIKKYNDNIIENLESSEELIEDTNLEHKSSSISEIADIIYDKLLNKENWKRGGVNRIEYYLNHLISKVVMDQSQSNVNGYIMNKNETMCCINTGLMDQFHNDIFIIDLDINNKNIDSKKLEVFNSKIQLLELGFEKDKIVQMPKPVKFYKDKSELIFDGTIDEFDLDNNNKLNHIIVERISRFPKEYKDYSMDVLCGLIRNSIIQAIKMSERDYKYFVPMYNFASDSIQFLVPVFLDKSMGSKPEIAAVIGYYKGYWCVNTIIQIEKAYDNARLISSPGATWLSKCLDE